jgi:hypothetical protein
LEEVETLDLGKIFTKFATTEQKKNAKEFQERFWNILLCIEEIGNESLKLHEPIPHAAGILQEWSNACVIVYITGRTENMRSNTLSELKKFGFPAKNTKLFMFTDKDFARAKGLDSSGPTLADARSNLMTRISKNYTIIRVIDDYPGYFDTYLKFKIPDRIGILRPKKYTQHHYVQRGATRVVESWKELENDPPKII